MDAAVLWCFVWNWMIVVFAFGRDFFEAANVDNKSRDPWPLPSFHQPLTFRFCCMVGEL
jgi:hypothetical protein